jgi:hypothetical protein
MFDGISPNHRIFGSGFDQAKTSVARTAQKAEDARERMQTCIASFPLKMISCYEVRKACGSCVEPSPLKIFG